MIRVNDVSTFSLQEQQYYSRQWILPGMSEQAQQRLKAFKVLLIGAGGLGCPVGLYLAGAGVGTLGIADDDTVDLSNLHRQVVHDVTKLGQLKVISMMQRLEALNPYIRVVPHTIRVSCDTIVSLLADYDLVVDGSDNFATRFLVGDACYLANKPLVQGAVYGFEGQLAVYPSSGPDEKTACHRCVFEIAPPEHLRPSCAEAGVVGVVPGTVGLMMATLAIKMLLPLGPSLTGQLLHYNALTLSTKHYTTARNLSCPLCGNHPTLQNLSAHDSPIQTTCTSPEMEISLLEALQWMNSGAPVIDVREPDELAADCLEGVLNWPLSRWHEATYPSETMLEALQKASSEGHPWLMLCRSGQRSLQATQWLKTRGYPQAVNVAGGMLAWRSGVNSC